MIHAHSLIVLGFVGVGEIGKAKAMFETLQKVAPEYVRTRLEGTWAYGRPEDRRRATTFVRIAAGLEDPSAADVALPAGTEILDPLPLVVPQSRTMHRSAPLRPTFYESHPASAA